MKTKPYFGGNIQEEWQLNNIFFKLKTNIRKNIDNFCNHLKIEKDDKFSCETCGMKHTGPYLVYSMKYDLVVRRVIARLSVPCRSCGSYGFVVE